MFCLEVYKGKAKTNYAKETKQRKTTKKEKEDARTSSDRQVNICKYRQKTKILVHLQGTDSILMFCVPCLNPWEAQLAKAVTDPEAKS